jgi:Na+/proline symporter
MKALRFWSFARVLLFSGAWILLCLLVAAAWLFFSLSMLSAASAGSGGIGAVSVGLSELMLAIPLGPPIILALLWLRARWRKVGES